MTDSTTPPAPEPQAPFEAARRSGLVRPSEPLLVLLSGGADSVCLLDVAVRLGAEVSALHVNYGLRAEAAGDEELCRQLCDGRGLRLTVEQASLSGEGNVQAEARDVRYAHAERLAPGDYATAHTASDQAETVVYRLAVSPGRRALLGMPARRGRLVRPLLGVTAGETRAYCRARGLPWREDASNADRRYARARIRLDVLPVLAELNPAAERTIAETSLLLRDEAEVLATAVERAIADLGAPAPALSEVLALPPALARLVLRRLAEDASGGAVALSREAADRVMALGRKGGSASLDLGGGLRAVVEYGRLRFSTETGVAAPEPVTLPVPGSVRFGAWEVAAEAGGRGEARVDARALGSSATVRAWGAGDRMRPVGVGGTKSLQDLFTDRKVPRELRHSLPVVEAAGEIAWVAGVAVGEAFAPREDREAVGLTARRREP